MKLRYRLLLAMLAGALTYPLFPRLGIWILVFPVIALFYVAAKGLKFWRATFVGFVGGLTFYIAHIYWISQYLGPEPLIALAALQAFFFAFALGLFGWVSIKLGSLLSGHRLVIALSFAFAMIWTAREHLSSHYPYGGFPWSKLAMSQSGSPLGNWVFYGGMPLLTSMLCLCTIGLYEALRFKALSLRLSGTAVAISLLLLPALLAPISVAPESGTLKIAAVQGNANAGLFANNQPGTFLNRHIAAARKFLSTNQPFDVMVWPENAVDTDVMRSSADRTALATFVRDEVKKPLVFGTITYRDGKLYNSSILWLPDKANVDWYDKQRPVPFAEYVPDREFWQKISPLVNLIQAGYTFGTRDGIFDTENHHLGTLICFEIAVDEVNSALVRDGAEVILSQTNNADFGRSDEAFQQLAIARLRAIETGRALVNVSTVGPSAVFLPDGSQTSYVEPFTSGVMVEQLPLRTSKTPAYFVALPFDLLNLALVALGFVFLSVAPLLKKRRSR